MSPRASRTAETPQPLSRERLPQRRHSQCRGVPLSEMVRESPERWKQADESFHEKSSRPLRGLKAPMLQSLRTMLPWRRRAQAQGPVKIGFVYPDTGPLEQPGRDMRDGLL